MHCTVTMYLSWYRVSQRLFLTILEILKMDFSCILAFNCGRQQGAEYSKVNIILAMKGNIWQCLQFIVKTRALDIMLKHLSNAFNCIARTIFFFHIAGMMPFRNINGKSDTRTYLQNLIWYIHHMMYLSIAKMYYLYFARFPELLSTDCLPPHFTLNQVDWWWLLAHPLLCRGNTINKPYQTVRDTPSIGDAPGGGFCLSIT